MEMMGFVKSIAGLVMLGGLLQTQGAVPLRLNVAIPDPANNAPAARKYKLSTQLTVDKSEIKLEAEVTHRIVDISPEGNVKVAVTQAAGKLTRGGSDVAYRPTPTLFVTYSMQGQVLEVEGETADADDTRFACLTTIVFSEKPVGVGDKWEFTTPENKEKLIAETRGKFEVLGTEKVAGKDCMKISFENKELGKDATAFAKGTQWIEVSTGTQVKVQCTMANIPLGGSKVNPTWELTFVPEKP